MTAVQHNIQSPEAESVPQTTPFYAMHVAAAARIVNFAGYSMPVQYKDGIKAEHLHTRSAAGLFDVSHMGQVLVRGDNVVAELEALLPLDIAALSNGQLSYTQLLNEEGGVLDDLIVTRCSEKEFLLVVNAGCKYDDIAYLQQRLLSSQLEYLEQHALLALQGPSSLAVLIDVFPELAKALSGLAFMHGSNVEIANHKCFISRSGYTGEDGFELSMPNDAASLIADKILAHQAVKWIGLGARDSLRLEAGLCLHGHELNSNISPIEAGLGWSVSKSRRKNGSKAGGFVGAKIILEQMAAGCERKRVGFRVDGRVPVREGASIVSESGQSLGFISSGGYSPSLSAPIAMGFVNAAFLASKEKCFAIVRGKPQPLTVCKMPFVPHQYARAK